MLQDIKTISRGMVNCYLVSTDSGYFLIDTGLASKRAEIDKEIENAGCRSGNLVLIIVTHGDYDHAGNAAYFRQKYGARIVIHPAESIAVEKGDMLLNRKRMTFFKRMLARMVIPVVTKLRTFDRFKADIFVEDGYDISGYGLEANIWHIPGHSRGSIGIITINGDFFCGDLLSSGRKPSLNSLIDDLAEANASVEKLLSLKIDTVYPGHGRPFPMALFHDSTDTL